METYGKMGTKALRILRTLQQDLDDSSPASALRPWHARYGLGAWLRFG